MLDTTTIQEAAWLGDGRMASRTITNSGVENSANDGGNTVVHPYYANRNPDRQGGANHRNPDRQGGASVVEERNGSNQVVRAYLWDLGGAGILPASPVWLEVNGDPTIGNDTNPDVAATGEGAESPADGRYFYHTDAAGTVVALTEYAAGAGSVNGRIVERYTRNPHGASFVLAGDGGSGEMSAAGVTSIVGNAFGSGGGSGPLFISTGVGGYDWHDEDAFTNGGGNPCRWTATTDGGRPVFLSQGRPRGEWPPNPPPGWPPDWPWPPARPPGFPPDLPWPHPWGGCMPWPLPRVPERIVRGDPPLPPMPIPTFDTCECSGQCQSRPSVCDWFDVSGATDCATSDYASLEGRLAAVIAGLQLTGQCGGCLDELRLTGALCDDRGTRQVGGFYHYKQNEWHRIGGPSQNLQLKCCVAAQLVKDCDCPLN